MAEHEPQGGRIGRHFGGRRLGPQSRAQLEFSGGFVTKGAVAMHPLALWDMLITWVVPFVVVFGTIVFVHELGHFLVARRVGIKVHEFALGFGRALFQWKRGETVYSIRLFPLGGFVKLAGMDAAVDPGGRNCTEDDERTFPEQDDRTAHGDHRGGTAGELRLCLRFAISFPLGCLGAVCRPDVLPDGPAAAAGLQPGDAIISVEGQPVSNLTELSAALQRLSGRDVDVEVERDGRRLDFAGGSPLRRREPTVSSSE